MACTRVYREASEGIKMGGGEAVKIWGFMGVHKQEVGMGGGGAGDKAPGLLSALHSLLNIKPGGCTQDLQPPAYRLTSTFFCLFSSAKVSET